MKSTVKIHANLAITVQPSKVGGKCMPEAFLAAPARRVAASVAQLARSWLPEEASRPARSRKFTGATGTPPILMLSALGGHRPVPLMLRRLPPAGARDEVPLPTAPSATPRRTTARRT